MLMHNKSLVVVFMFFFGRFLYCYVITFLINFGEGGSLYQVVLLFSTLSSPVFVFAEFGRICSRGPSQ